MSALSNLLRRFADAIDSGAAELCARCRHVRGIHTGPEGCCTGKYKVPTLSQIVFGVTTLGPKEEHRCPCASFLSRGN